MVIHIKWDGNKKDMQLPVNPSSFTSDGSQKNTSLYVHNLGEINLKGKRGLYEVSISSFFPAQYYNFCKVKPKDPYDYYVKKLKRLYERNETVHLIITKTNINMYCTIESFSWGEKDRSGDVYYTISFKEYRAVKATSRNSKGSSSKSVTWKKGDTWQKLTKAALGSSSKWKTVKSANSAVISKAKKAYIKAYKKSHKNKAPAKVPEATALIGYKVVIKA